MKLNLSQQMKEILEDYTDDVMHEVENILVESGAEAASELQAASPKRKTRGGGKYAKSWTSEQTSGRTYTTVNVHNKKYYRLTHLLENGHAKRGGGRVEAIPHIGTINDETQEKAIEKIKEAIARA